MDTSRVKNFGMKIQRLIEGKNLSGDGNRDVQGDTPQPAT